LQGVGSIKTLSDIRPEIQIIIKAFPPDLKFRNEIKINVKQIG
jgi:hypothetical protein